MTTLADVNKTLNNTESNNIERYEDLITRLSPMESNVASLASDLKLSNTYLEKMSNIMSEQLKVSLEQSKILEGQRFDALEAAAENRNAIRGLQTTVGAGAAGGGFFGMGGRVGPGMGGRAGGIGRFLPDILTGLAGGVGYGYGTSRLRNSLGGTRGLGFRSLGGARGGGLPFGGPGLLSRGLTVGRLGLGLLGGPVGLALSAGVIGFMATNALMQSEAWEKLTEAINNLKERGDEGLQEAGQFNKERLSAIGAIDEAGIMTALADTAFGGQLGLEGLNLEQAAKAIDEKLFAPNMEAIKLFRDIDASATSQQEYKELQDANNAALKVNTEEIKRMDEEAANFNANFKGNVQGFFDWLTSFNSSGAYENYTDPRLRPLDNNRGEELANDITESMSPTTSGGPPNMNTIISDNSNNSVNSSTNILGNREKPIDMYLGRPPIGVYAD